MGERANYSWYGLDLGLLRVAQIVPGFEHEVAKYYDELWASIRLPVDYTEIDFRTLKDTRGTKLGHVLKLMKHLGISPAVLKS